MLFGIKTPEEERVTFINNCIENDTPRLNSEVYPENVKVLKDISYIDDGLDQHKLDVYLPDNMTKTEEAFVLIHGGAFVYGFKELDKMFGMRLSLKAKMPVVNINYTLLPESDLSQVMNEIYMAMNFASKEYGIKVFHTVGDSAGGYLCYITALAATNTNVSEGLGISQKQNFEVHSANPICGCYENSDVNFPGVYFQKEDGFKLNKFVYNLKDLVEEAKKLRVAIVTGEDDFLRKDNYELNEILAKNGIKKSFYDALNREGMNMGHVFPIYASESPEGQKAIEIIANNALNQL